MNNILDILAFQQFDNFEFIARQVVEGFITGLHRSPYHGFSVEFAEHRIYNKGESTRHIDWKLFARTDKLFVKKYEEETNLRCQIVIDTSSSMLFPYEGGRYANKLTFSAYSAAALAYLLRRQRDAVGLSLFDNNLWLHTQARSSLVHAQRIYAELATLIQGIPGKEKLGKQSSTTDALHQVADNINTRSLVVIFSDMFSDSQPDELFAALQHLKFNKHEVILFHVIDRELEQQFAFDNRPHKLISLETGEEFKINPADFRDGYVDKVTEMFAQLRSRCAQYHIDMIDVDIKDDFRTVLLAYLVKRNKLL